jgi:hypothetical protein
MSIEVLLGGTGRPIVAGRARAVRHPKVPRDGRGGPGASAHRRIVPVMRRWNGWDDAVSPLGCAPGGLRTAVAGG